MYNKAERIDTLHIIFWLNMVASIITFKGFISIRSHKFMY